MAEKNSVNKYRVHLIETDSALDRMLSFFFTNLASNATLVPAEHAEIAVIDYDAPKATAALDRFRKQVPDCPIVALAYDAPAEKNLLHLPKPVTLDQLEKFFDDAPWQALQLEPQTVETELQTEPPRSPKEDLTLPVQTSTVWNLPQDQLSEELYDARHYLQGWLQRAYRQANLTKIPVRLLLPEGPLYLYPREKVVVTPMTEAFLIETCRRPLEQVVLEAAPEAVLSEHEEGSHFSMRAFLWQVALYCSRGRLEQALVKKELFLFKRWPNLTRWLRTPSALPIVAFFYNGPHRIEEATTDLAVPQAEVQALLSAAAALDLLAFPKKEITSPVEVPQLQRQERSILRGFLKRLLGI